MKSGDKIRPFASKRIFFIGLITVAGLRLRRRCTSRIKWWVVESDARTHRTLRRCARNEAETSLFRESSPQDESVRPRTFGVRTRPRVAFESRQRPRTSDSGDCYFSSRKVTAPVSRL